MFPSAEFIGIGGWYHLLVFGVGIPLMALRARRKVLDKKQPLPNRLKQFKGTALMLFLFGALSLMMAHVQWIELFPRKLPPLPGVAAGVAMYVACVVFMRPRWRRAVEKRARVVYLFMPENAAERAWWIVVSVLAGISEEITWRGVQTALLAFLTGSLWMGALLSAVSFALGHINQGWKSALIIGVFALCFQVVVWLSGSLYVAMAVHAIYDITAGIMYGKLGRELGYKLEEESAPQQAKAS